MAFLTNFIVVQTHGRSRLLNMLHLLNHPAYCNKIIHLLVQFINPHLFYRVIEHLLFLWLEILLRRCASFCSWSMHNRSSYLLHTTRTYGWNYRLNVEVSHVLSHLLNKFLVLLHRIDVFVYYFDKILLNTEKFMYNLHFLVDENLDQLSTLK